MRTKDKKMIEAFEIYVGGTLQDGGNLNEKLKGKVEAEQLSDVVKDLLIHFKNTKEPGEAFFDYMNRVGTNALQESLDRVASGSIKGMN